MPLYGSRFPEGKRQYLGKQEVAGGGPANLPTLLLLARLSSVFFPGAGWHLKHPMGKPEVCSGSFGMQPVPYGARPVEVEMSLSRAIQCKG